jgi:hypothetical protein
VFSIWKKGYQYQGAKTKEIEDEELKPQKPDVPVLGSNDLVFQNR